MDSGLWIYVRLGDSEQNRECRMRGGGSLVWGSDSVSQIVRDSNLLCFSFAEQLALCMKAEEFLSAALHAAKENITSGQLLPSSTVKQGDSSFPDCVSILNVCQKSNMKESRN